MILPSQLNKALIATHPQLSSTEKDARLFLESNPIIADCCDLKYATNMFRNYLERSK